MNPEAGTAGATAPSRPSRADQSPIGPGSSAAAVRIARPPSTLSPVNRPTNHPEHATEQSYIEHVQRAEQDSRHHSATAPGPATACADTARTRIMHIADVHLDRPFVGMEVEAARARRGALRSAFDRCLEVARSREVDLV